MVTVITGSQGRPGIGKGWAERKGRGRGGRERSQGTWSLVASLEQGTPTRWGLGLRGRCTGRAAAH